ncbi:MAG: calcium/sodium antiporter [Opitutales bacterium]
MENILKPFLVQWQAENPVLYLVVLAGLIVVGILSLFKGGALLTDGSSSLAKELGVSPIVIGLTVVSMATSAPELFTCLSAVIGGHPELVAGNIVGSNLANIGLVLGLALMAKPISQKNLFPPRQLAFLMGSSFVFASLCLLPHNNSIFTRRDGTICIVLMLVFLYLLKKDRHASSAEEDFKQTRSTGKHILFVLSATVLLWFGSEIFVLGSVRVAEITGVSDAVIGLTLMAIGTSLPELGTSYSLVRRGEHGILIGNVVGSNIFNMLFVGGVTGVVLPFSIPSSSLIEFPAMLFLTLVLWVFLSRKGDLTKVHGTILLFIYFASIATAVWLHRVNM